MSYMGPVVAELLFSKSYKPNKSRNFYPIVTKLDIHKGIVKIRIESKLKLCGSYRSRMTFLQNFLSPP